VRYTAHAAFSKQTKLADQTARDRQAGAREADVGHEDAQYETEGLIAGRDVMNELAAGMESDYFVK
jgi:hypothetical protein